MRRGVHPRSLAALAGDAVVSAFAVGAVAAVAITLPDAFAASAVVSAQPRHPVFLIYDGFIRNADGSLTLAFGYHNAQIDAWNAP